MDLRRNSISESRIEPPAFSATPSTSKAARSCLTRILEKIYLIFKELGERYKSSSKIQLTAKQDNETNVSKNNKIATEKHENYEQVQMRTDESDLQADIVEESDIDLRADNDLLIVEESDMDLGADNDLLIAEEGEESGPLEQEEQETSPLGQVQEIRELVQGAQLTAVTDKYLESHKGDTEQEEALRKKHEVTVIHNGKDKAFNMLNKKKFLRYQTIMLRSILK